MVKTVAVTFCHVTVIRAELSMGWVDPWVRLSWVGTWIGSGWVGIFQFLVGWVGLKGSC